MLLTDAFSYIHMPKTGGTFVTFVLERLHGVRRGRFGNLRRRIEVALGTPPSRRRRHYGELVNVEPKHGTCHDLPASHAGKPVVSCMRGPHEWYVSQYEFGWWRRAFEYETDDHPTPAGWAIKQSLPAFAQRHPNLDVVGFEQFMQLCQDAAKVYNQQSGTSWGLYTHSFVRYFYKDPQAVLRNLSDEYISSGQHLSDRFDVFLIKTESLAADLESALRSFGYRDDDLRFICKTGKILPMGVGRRDDQCWESYYTPALRCLVRQTDHPLFKMFPAYELGEMRVHALEKFSERLPPTV